MEIQNTEMNRRMETITTNVFTFIIDSHTIISALSFSYAIIGNDNVLLLQFTKLQQKLFICNFIRY